MRKCVLYISLSLLLFFLGGKNVKAECTYARQYELSKIASNIKANYTVSEEPELFFTINIFNLTEDVYASVTNNVDISNPTYFYNPTNLGNVSFESYDIYSKVQYKIAIKSLDTECGSATLRTISIITPRYNPFYSTALCQENKEYSLCYKWSDYETTFEDLKERLSNIKEEENKKKEEKKELKWYEKLLKFIKDNYLILSIVVVVLGSAIVTTIIIVRKRRKI